jgi:hypothetical protein
VAPSSGEGAMSRHPSCSDDEPARAGAGASAQPLEIAHHVMDAAVERGDAKPLGQGIWWAARYADAWWVQYENGWLRVIDEATERDLAHVATRLAEVSATAHGDISGPRPDGHHDGPSADEDSQAGAR